MKTGDHLVWVHKERRDERIFLHARTWVTLTMTLAAGRNVCSGGSEESDDDVSVDNAEQGMQGLLNMHEVYQYMQEALLDLRNTVGLALWIT